MNQDKLWSQTLADGPLLLALFDAGDRLLQANAAYRQAWGLVDGAAPPWAEMVKAARQAGVSAAAPYRHFTGREQLIEEVARQGFLEFADRLAAAFGDGRPSPLSAFLRMGDAYLRFAAEKPGYYMAMFEAGLSIIDVMMFNSPADTSRMLDAYELS